MFNFEKVLKRANEEYKKYVVNVLRSNSVKSTVSGEVEAMGKAIVEALNEELFEPIPEDDTDFINPDNDPFNL